MMVRGCEDLFEGEPRWSLKESWRVGGREAEGSWRRKEGTSKKNWVRAEL